MPVPFVCVYANECVRELGLGFRERARERERERERALLGAMSITGWSRARPGDSGCVPFVFVFF